MLFRPPRCPYLTCYRHARPDDRCFVLHGWYHPRCRRLPVPRFRCTSCRRTFSKRAFFADFRDKRPNCNVLLFQLLTSGVGLRQTGRCVGLSPEGVQKKFVKLAANCALLHENLSRSLPERLRFILDEEETYERASIRPLTVPIVVEESTWFIISTSVGSIRRLAKKGSTRRQKQDFDEQKHGRRRDESRVCVRRALRAVRRRTRGSVGLVTDQKASYATVANSVFGDDVRHETVSGEDPRTTWNPLFPINTTIAMTRDNCGRLRRRSWLVTKKSARLEAQLALFTVYRNYVRKRFNRDSARFSPAVGLNLVDRNLSVREVLRWRQDWGERSPHPASWSGRQSIADSPTPNHA